MCTFSIKNKDGTETIIGQSSSTIFEIGPMMLKRGGINRTRKRLWKMVYHKSMRSFMKPKIIVIHGIIENVNFNIKYDNLF